MRRQKLPLYLAYSSDFGSSDFGNVVIRYYRKSFNISNCGLLASRKFRQREQVAQEGESSLSRLPR